jgi:hypothetical protein
VQLLRRAALPPDVTLGVQACKLAPVAMQPATGRIAAPASVVHADATVTGFDSLRCDRADGDGTGGPGGACSLGILIRIILAAAAAVTAWFVVPDAPSFGVVQGMVGLGLIAAVVVALALWRR